LQSLPCQHANPRCTAKGLLAALPSMTSEVMQSWVRKLKLKMIRETTLRSYSQVLQHTHKLEYSSRQLQQQTMSKDFWGLHNGINTHQVATLPSGKHVMHRYHAAEHC
jgi:hypothetical protein